VNEYRLTTFRRASRGSSVSIVSGYGLDERAIEVRSPAEAKRIFPLACVQTGSGVHPAFCPRYNGSSFPGGVARPGRDSDHSPPSRAEVVNEYELFLSPLRLHRCVVGLPTFRKVYEYACVLFLDTVLSSRKLCCHLLDPIFCVPFSLRGI
jgi:hypothetical protein